MSERELPLPCPRCKTGAYTPQDRPWEMGMPARPVVSRTDGETLICSECGNYESMADFMGDDLGPREAWPQR